MCCTRLAKNTGRKYRQKFAIWAISSQLGHISTIGKKLLNSNISSTFPHNMLNFGPLTAEICLPVWDTPANFNKFRVLPSFLQQCCSPKAVSCAGTLHIHFQGALAPDRILPGAKFTLRPSLAVSYIGNFTARHSSSWHQPNFGAWYKQWNYRTFAEGATYIRQGGHHVGHWPTFLVLLFLFILGDYILRES